MVHDVGHAVHHGSRHCCLCTPSVAAELHSQARCAHPVQIQGMIDRGSDQCGTTGLRILSLAGRIMRAAADDCPKQLPDFKPKLLQLCSTGSPEEAKAATRSAGNRCVPAGPPCSQCSVG